METRKWRKIQENVIVNERKYMKLMNETYKKKVYKISEKKEQYSG